VPHARHLGARQLGHGRVGLYVCVAMLLVNAAAVVRRDAGRGAPRL
jgi:hypothetical protein